MIFQSIVGIAIFLILGQTILQWRRKTISLLQASIWLFFWILVFLFLLYPDILNRFADLLGIGRGVDVLIYLSILVLFLLVFKICIKLRQIEQNITKIVRDRAIQHPIKKE